MFSKKHLIGCSNGVLAVLVLLILFIHSVTFGTPRNQFTGVSPLIQTNQVNISSCGLPAGTVDLPENAADFSSLEEDTDEIPGDSGIEHPSHSPLIHTEGQQSLLQLHTFSCIAQKTPIWLSNRSMLI